VTAASSNVEDWSNFQATRAFVVLSLLCGAAASICGFVARAISWGSVAPLALASAASLFGLLAMACFAGAGRDFTILKTSGTYSYGAGFGLCIFSWVVFGGVAALYGWWHRKGPGPAERGPAPPPKRTPSGRL
jgi:hypothetical protein